MGGIEHFDGGDGVDIVAYLAVPVELIIDPETFNYVIIGEGVTVDLADPSRNTGFAAGDTYAGIESSDRLVSWTTIWRATNRTTRSVEAMATMSFGAAAETISSRATSATIA